MQCRSLLTERTSLFYLLGVYPDARMALAVFMIRSASPVVDHFNTSPLTLANAGVVVQVAVGATATSPTAAGTTATGAPAPTVAGSTGVQCCHLRFASSTARLHMFVSFETAEGADCENASAGTGESSAKAKNASPCCLKVLLMPCSCHKIANMSARTPQTTPKITFLFITHLLSLLRDC